MILRRWATLTLVMSWGLLPGVQGASAQEAAGSLFASIGEVTAGGGGNGVCDAPGPGNGGGELTAQLNNLLGTPGFNDLGVSSAQRRAAFRFCDSLTGTTANGWSGQGSDAADAAFRQALSISPDEVFAGMDNALANFDLQTSNVAKRISLVRLARRQDRRHTEALARAHHGAPAATASDALDGSSRGFARLGSQDRAQQVLLALQEGINAGDGGENDGIGFFLNGRVHVVKGEQSVSERGSEGFGGGFTLGVDKLIGEDFFAGVAMGYTRISTNFDGSGSDADLDAVTITGYGAYFPTDALYIDGSISTAYLGFEQSNEIVFFDGGPPDRLEGDSDGAQFGFDIGVGYTLDLGELTGRSDDEPLTGLTIEPLARLNFLYTYIEDYEQSSDGSLDLSIDEQETISVTAHVGFRTEYPISTRHGILTPYVRAAYVHEFNDENDDLEVGFAALAAFGAPSVKLKPQATDSHYGNFGAGVAATLGQGLSQFLDYDVIAGHDNVTIHQVTAGVRLEF